MNNDIKRSSLFSFLFILLNLNYAHAELAIPIQLKLKNPSNVYPTETGISVKVQVLTPTGGCILREELFSAVDMLEGQLSLSLGNGARGARDPNITLVSLYDNAVAKSGLTCVDTSDNVTGIAQTYSPTSTDPRLLRVIVSTTPDTIRADFNMKSLPYAKHAEMVGGKAGADLLIQATGTQLNQTNLNNLLLDNTRYTNLINLATTGQAITATTATTATNATSADTANTATNFTGTLVGDVTGTQSATSVVKIRGVTVSATGPTSGQVLAYNGSQYVPTTLAVGGGAVNSVNGQTGTVVLGVADISGAVSTSTSFSGDVTGNIAATVVDTVGGKTSAEIAASVDDTQAAISTNSNGTLVKRDGVGNIEVTSISSTNNSTQNVFLYNVANTNYVKFIAPTTFSNYTLTLPVDDGTSGQVLQTNGTGVLSWVSQSGGGGGSGTVTNVSSANSYLTVANPTTAPILTVNVGTASGTLASGNDARITGALQSTVFNGYIASANCTTGQTMYWNSVSSTFLCQNINLSGDITGSASATIVSKIKGINISATLPTSGQVLAYDGTQYSPTTISGGGGGAVNSVNGKTGTVVLTAGDINGAVSTTTSFSGDVTGNVTATVVSTVGGKTSAQISTSVNDTLSATALATNNAIVKRDGSGNSSFATISSTNNSTQNVYIYEGTNTNSVRIKAPTTFSNYILTLPINDGNNGQVLQTDGSGNLSWTNPVSGGGAVASVTSTNAFLAVVNPFTNPELTINVGTASGTLASGNDSRITGALQTTTFAGYVTNATNCTALETMYWSSVSGGFECQAINATSANTGGTIVARDGAGDFTTNNMTSDGDVNVAGVMNGVALESAISRVPTTTGTSLDYVVSFGAAVDAKITSNVTGQSVKFIVHTSSGASAMLQVGGAPAVAMVSKLTGTQLNVGDLKANVIVEAVFDGTNWVVEIPPLYFTTANPCGTGSVTKNSSFACTAITAANVNAGDVVNCTPNGAPATQLVWSTYTGSGTIVITLACNNNDGNNCTKVARTWKCAVQK